MKSIDIDSKIKKNILLGKKIPHSTSQPVIHMENGQYVLSSFVFFFNKDDLKKSEVDRPSLWCISLKNDDSLFEDINKALQELKKSSRNEEHQTPEKERLHVKEAER